MRELVYVSEASKKFRESEDVMAFMDVALEQNTKHEITGFLWFDGKHFLQLIEGPHENIAQLWKNIQADDRHKNVECLHYTHIKERAFPDWAMNYSRAKSVIKSENELQLRSIIGEDVLTAPTANFGPKLSVMHYGLL